MQKKVHQLSLKFLYSRSMGPTNCVLPGRNKGVIRASLLPCKAASQFQKLLNPPHSSILSEAMTTGSAITVIVASFMMAMVVELMMPLLLTMHLFSSMATWVRHLLLPPSIEKEESQSFLGNKALASQISHGDMVKNTLQG